MEKKSINAKHAAPWKWGPVLFFLFYISFFFSVSLKGQVPAFHWENFSLQNGMKVLLQPDSTASEVSVEFWIAAGEGAEKKGQFGFAHFFEHATPYGFIHDTALSRQFATYRTNSNAQTRKDYTRYYVQVKPDGLPLALSYISGRLQADTADITDSIIEKHRQNVINEITRQEGSPLYGAIINTVRNAGTFGEDSPYGHSAYGSIEANRNFTSRDVKEWYSSYFYPTNTIVFVVGKFDPLAAKEMIRKELGRIKGIHAPMTLQYVRPKTSLSSRLLQLPLKDHFISITWAIPNQQPDIDPGVQLLSEILDKRLKGSRGTLPSILELGSSDLYIKYRHAGQFGMFASFNSLQDSTKVENHLYHILQEIIRNGVSENELTEAKEAIAKQTEKKYKKLGFIGSRTELLGEGLLFTGNPGYYYQRAIKQNWLRSRDIQKIALMQLNRKGFRILVAASGG